MDGTIKVFCINLKHRKDRWNRFSQQPELKKLKDQYGFERFEGINGSELNIQSDSRISLRTKRNVKDHVRRDHEELNSAGGVGCYLSHTSVWKKFLEGSEAWAMIFEDDAILEPGFLAHFQRAKQELTLLPQIPDVWFFSPPTDWYFSYKGKPQPRDVKNNTLGPWTMNTCASFTGYLISRRGAEKLLETAFPLDMHVDLYTCLNGELGRVLTVSHEDVATLPIEVKSKDTDIQVPEGCAICDVPTNYRQKGIVMLNIPILLISLTTAGLMLYVARGK